MADRGQGCHAEHARLEADNSRGQAPHEGEVCVLSSVKGILRRDWQVDCQGTASRGWWVAQGAHSTHGMLAMGVQARAMPSWFP